MSSSPASTGLPFGSIDVSDLVLDHPAAGTAGARLRALLGRPSAHRGTPARRALDRVTFRVTPGELVGVIGHNGAGKSSLLRVLAGILKPSSGTIDTRGRTMTMPVLDSEWDRSATGRERLTYAGLLLGFGREDLFELVADAAHFSGLGEAVDLPYRERPAWMRRRLELAFALRVPSDILLLDEPLASEDERLAASCRRRLEEVRRAGRTIVLASNDLTEVARLASRLLVLHEGALIFDGPVAQGLGIYERLLAEQSQNGRGRAPALQDVDVAVHLSGDHDQPGATIEVGQSLRVIATVRAKKDLGERTIALRFVHDNLRVPYAFLMPRRWATVRGMIGYQDTVYFAEGETRISWSIPHWIGGEGTYGVDVYLGPRGEVPFADPGLGRIWRGAATFRSLYGNVSLRGGQIFTEVPVETVTIQSPTRHEPIHLVGPPPTGATAGRPGAPAEDGLPHSPEGAGGRADAGRFSERRMRAILTAVGPYTMVHESGVRFAVEQAVEAILAGRPGVIVECGVWRGGTSLAMLLAQRERFGRVERPVYLLDSFEGLPAVTPADGPLAKRWQEGGHPETYFDNCRADVEDVRRMLREHGFRDQHYRVIKGWFDTTVPALAQTLHGQGIALLRLDGDWYDSTMVCLRHLLPLLADDGVVIVDDYYAWDGCARAVHDYLSQHDLSYRIRSLYGCFGAYFRKKPYREHFEEV